MFRAANVNHRTTMEEMESLVEVVKQNERRLLPELRAAKRKKSVRGKQV